MESVDDVASYSGVTLALAVAPVVHDISVLRNPGPELDSALHNRWSLNEAQVEGESAKDFFVSNTGGLA